LQIQVNLEVQLLNLNSFRENEMTHNKHNYRKTLIWLFITQRWTTDKKQERRW